jgi:hypothetical protein
MKSIVANHDGHYIRRSSKGIDTFWGDVELDTDIGSGPSYLGTPGVREEVVGRGTSGIRKVVQRLARLRGRHSGEQNAVGRRLTGPGSRGRLFEVKERVASTINVIFGSVVGEPLVVHFRWC